MACEQGCRTGAGCFGVRVSRRDGAQRLGGPRRGRALAPRSTAPFGQGCPHRGARRRCDPDRRRGRSRVVRRAARGRVDGGSRTSGSGLRLPRPRSLGRPRAAWSLPCYEPRIWVARGPRARRRGGLRRVFVGLGVPRAVLLYVASVSAVARLEDAGSDDEVGQTPRVALAVAALSLLAVAWLSPSSGVRVAPLLSLSLSLLGAFALLREAARRKSWTRSDAGRATGLGLRRLLVFSALVALASAPSLRDARSVLESPSGLAAALILCGFPLSAALRRVFPPT